MFICVDSKIKKFHNIKNTLDPKIEKITIDHNNYKS